MIRRLGEARRSVHVVDIDRTCKKEASSQLVCAADMETVGTLKRWAADNRSRPRVAACVVLQQSRLRFPLPRRKKKLKSTEASPYRSLPMQSTGIPVTASKMTNT
ncbi:hypothetical protein J3459_006373 [Metarhizium acridum]|nr:hypothetical protein J3459_006373 [Metarhizium acridum]